MACFVGHLSLPRVRPRAREWRFGHQPRWFTANATNIKSVGEELQEEADMARREQLGRQGRRTESIAPAMLSDDVVVDKFKATQKLAEQTYARLHLR
jgi:hypothetical protein